MVALAELVSACDQELQVSEYEDYCPNGLQVEATAEVTFVVTGVTASLALIEAAAQAGADLLVVHHGYFWKNEPQPLVGMKGRRVAALYRHGISLVAYHLPLDAHPQLGNNAGLGRALAVETPAPVAPGDLLWGGRLPGMTPRDLEVRLGEVLDRPPLWLAGGPERIERLAWCTGAAQGLLERAADMGFDAFISGEVSEASHHIARERGIHYYAAGHHATERFGVQALGQWLARRFGLAQRFIDLPNPV